MPNTERYNRVCDLNTSEGAREFIAAIFITQLQRHDFTTYIEQQLAGDFACALSRYIVTLRDSADADAAIDLVAAERLKTFDPATAISFDAMRSRYAFDEDRELALCRLSWEKDRSIVFGDYWDGWKAALAERAAAIQDQPCVDVNARALERLLDVAGSIHKGFADYNAIRYAPLTEAFRSPSSGKMEENGVTVRVRLLNELGAALEALKGYEVSV